MVTSNFLGQTSNTAMNTENKDGEKTDDGATSYLSDDFEREEVSLENEWSLTENEEDLEATATRNQAEHSSHTNQQPSVVDFLRSFLYQAGMTETLDCFQTEWSEMVQRGLADEGQVGVVPVVYTENQRLESELKKARQEREEIRQTASAAAATLARVQGTRSVHRLQHQRIVQEKNRIIEDMKKLKLRCDCCETEVKRMLEKYQAALRSDTPMALEGDTP